MSKSCLSSLTLPRLAETMKELAQPAFRAGQIYRWLHQKQVTDFSAMTDQPKTLLKALEERYYIAAPVIRRRSTFQKSLLHHQINRNRNRTRSQPQFRCKILLPDPVRIFR